MFDRQLISILHTSPSGMMLLDSNFHILECNEPASHIFGYDSGELIGQPLSVLLPPWIRNRHGALEQQFLANNQNRVFKSGNRVQVFEAARKDGGVAYVHIGISILQNDQDDQNRKQFLIAISDHTELKRLNRTLRQTNTQLQTKLNEIEKIKKEQSHLLHVISHELKTPLHVTHSLLDLLTDDRTTKVERVEFTRELEGQIDYVVTAIRLLIDFADYTEGRLELNLEPMPLNSWLHKCLQIVRQTLPDNPTKISSHFTGLIGQDTSCPDHLVVLADRTRLQSVLVGILMNALQHAEAEHVHVHVSLNTAPKPHLRCVVTDDGKGISQAVLEHAFEPLANLTERQKRASGGMGIGLSMYAIYLKAMAGLLQVNNRSDKQGTEVVFELPIKEFAPHGDLQTNHRNTPFSTLEGLHILLVDDDNMIRKIIGIRLQRLGAMVSTASNGQEAVETAQANADSPFDLILMDLNMPIMDGFEATRRIRQLSGYGPVPILAVTAAVESEVRPKAMAVGMTDCYSKPFDPALLLSSFKRAKPIFESV